MKVIRPTDIIYTKEFTASHHYTVDGWYSLLSEYDETHLEYYIRNKKILATLSHIKETYLFYPDGKYYYKEEINRLIKLIMFS